MESSNANFTQSWTVYILKCSDRTYYTGFTSCQEKRMQRHMRGEVHYTKDKLPFTLITYIVFTDKYKALEFESYLKTGSGCGFRNKRLV